MKKKIITLSLISLCLLGGITVLAKDKKTDIQPRTAQALVKVKPIEKKLKSTPVVNKVLSSSSSIASIVEEEVQGVILEVEPIEEPIEFEEVEVFEEVKEEVFYEQEVAPEEVLSEEITEEYDVEEYAEEAEAEEEMYDQLTQKGDKNLVVEVEEEQDFFEEDESEIGFAFIRERFDIPTSSTIIPTSPSGHVYQYEVYENSPDGGHLNLSAIYQYDATGQRAFSLDMITGVWVEYK